MAPTKSCGSSGAVCALMGCQLVLLLRDVSKVLVWSVRSSIAECDFTTRNQGGNHSSRTGSAHHRSHINNNDDEYHNSSSSATSSSRNRNNNNHLSTVRLMKILTTTGGKLLQVLAGSIQLITTAMHYPLSSFHFLNYSTSTYTLSSSLPIYPLIVPTL